MHVCVEHKGVIGSLVLCGFAVCTKQYPIVIGEARKHLLFWRCSGGLWFSQVRLGIPERDALNLNKSPILQTPFTIPLLFTVPLVCTLTFVQRSLQNQFERIGYINNNIT